MERDRIGMWGQGDNVVPGKASGLDRIKHPGLNKVSEYNPLDYILNAESSANISIAEVCLLENMLIVF